MRERLLPAEDELAGLWPGPGSATWRRAGDARTLLAAGYALLLQVSHPTVGAGVAEHSRFREDPWGRLLRTLDFTNAVVYAEPAEAAAIARRVRARHRTINGTLPDGSRYHALEPGAYAWVWATLYAAIVGAHERFGEPLHGGERELLWREWRGLGRLLGVRARDLPEGLEAYESYFAATVAGVLEPNASVRAVLDSLRRPAGPPLPALAQPLWWVGRAPSAHLLSLTTAGLLPAPLRARLGLGWSAAQELELGALALAARASAPLLPPLVRGFGPRYLGWRATNGAAPGRPAASRFT